MKAQETKNQGKKIELPENVDFTNLVALALGKAQMDPNLSKDEKKALTKITPGEHKLIISAVEKAAKDGLYEDEIDQIFGDINDLIEAGWKSSGFEKLIKDPSNAKYKLTPEMAETIKSLTPDQIATLKKDLHSQGPTLGDQLKHFFSNALDVLLPIFKGLLVDSMKIGVTQLTPLIQKNIGGDWGKFLEDGVKSVTTGVTKVVINEQDHKVELSGANASHIEVVHHDNQ